MVGAILVNKCAAPVHTPYTSQVNFGGNVIFGEHLMNNVMFIWNDHYQEHSYVKKNDL